MTIIKIYIYIFSIRWAFYKFCTFGNQEETNNRTTTTEKIIIAKHKITILELKKKKTDRANIFIKNIASV